MKRWNLLLAVMLAVMMLMGAWSATAELALEIDNTEASEPAELEIAPEAFGDAPDAVLELNDALALDGLELNDLVPETETTVDAALDGLET